MTNSYKTGTVSVTNGSAVVNGTGTAWAIENVVGGMFRIGTFEAEIIAATNTQLTLDANYTGATASGLPYRIWLQDAQAASNITINRQLGEIIAQLVDSAPEIQDFLDAATPGDALSALGISTFIKTLLDDADAPTARGTLGANNAGNLNTGTVPDGVLAAKYKAAVNYLGDINPNTLVVPGWAGAIGASHANLPKTGYYNIEVIGLVGSYLTQIAWPYANNLVGNGLWMRGSADGGATWLPWKQIYFAEEQDARYALLSGASFSGSITTVGDILTSGNLRANGGVVYLNPATSAYIYWDGTKYTTHLGDIHHDGNAARRPQAAAGNGQWVRIYPGENANCVLPSGGSWAWFVYLLTGSGAEFTGNHSAGVHAGGTALYPAQGTNTYWCGFAWRVSE